MIKRIMLVAVMALVLVMLLPTVVQGATDGEITGHVTHGATESAVADAEVVLHIWTHGGDETTNETITDSEGAFRFDTLDTSSEHYYRVATEYDGAEYWGNHGEWAAFQMGETSLSIDVAVYDSGQVTGQVMNGTEGNNVPAGTTVSLSTYTHATGEVITESTTDAEGNFEFGALNPTSNYFYLIWVKYQGVEYLGGEWANLDVSSPTLSSDVTVYNSTESDASVSLHSLVVDIKIGEDQLEVSEVYIFENSGNETYIGEEINETRQTLVFSLPDGASWDSVAWGGQIDGAGLVDVGDGSEKADILPLMPTSSHMRMIQMTYTLEITADEYELVRPLGYDVGRVDLYVDEVGVDVTCDQLTEGEAKTSGDGSSVALYFTTRDFTSDALDVTIAGLNESNALQNMLLWVVVISVLLLIFGLAVGYGIIRMRSKPSSSEPVLTDSLSLLKEKLLREIAELDDLFESGGIPEEEYEKLRAEKKAKLLDLMR